MTINSFGPQDAPSYSTLECARHPI